jgi:hypothetical protein
MAPDLTVQLTGSDSTLSIWVPGVIAFIATIVGAVLGGWIAQRSAHATEEQRAKKALELEQWRNHERARVLSLAIASEVEAAIRMINFRKYLPTLESAVRVSNQGTSYLFYFDVGEDYLPVASSASVDVGALPGAAPTLLTEMLTLFRSVKLDLDDLADPNSMIRQHMAPADLAGRYGELLTLLREAIAVGMRFVQEIDVQLQTKLARTWDSWNVDTLGLARVNGRLIVPASSTEQSAPLAD